MKIVGIAVFVECLWRNFDKLGRSDQVSKRLGMGQWVNSVLLMANNQGRHTDCANLLFCHARTICRYSTQE